MSSSEKIRVGIVGCGKFGGFHLNKYLARDDAQLVFVADPMAEGRAALSEKAGVPGLVDWEDMMDQVDALSITTPASFHYSIAEAALEAGLHCFVEKPLAAKAADGALLVEKAKAKDRVLHVGHHERYSFRAMQGPDHLKGADDVTFSRLGLVEGERNRDVSAVWDLMTHDLDMAVMAFGPDFQLISAGAFLGPDAGTDQPDAYEAIEAVFQVNGAKVTFQASRLAPKQVRQIRVSGGILLDLNSPQQLNGHQGQTVADPLEASVDDFLSAIKHGTDLIAPPDQAQIALDLADQIERAVTG